MHAAAAVESALIIDKLFSRSLSGPAHFWAGVLCGRYHSVRKGGGGDGSFFDFRKGLRFRVFEASESKILRVRVSQSP
jgi:hypothetical protein